ncbi:thermonuclease family protein [Aneurinibacillus tyrosinisolvens]|uniref:thermonuclease family protein n=1 Tax=Aneurinibacillus tyrosinisolvens TaxID=1443435 RepID=UPI00069C06BE|nr:thermonuclease family protein [Aneurinibacillus tyrosinisolvens]
MKKIRFFGVIATVLLLSGCNQPKEYAPGTVENTPPGAVSQVEATDKVSRAAGIVDAVAGTDLKGKVEQVDKILNADAQVDQAVGIISGAVGKEYGYASGGHVSATVLKAVDGDTIKARVEGRGTQTIRALLIDSPESQPSKKAPTPQPLGKESSAFTHKLLDGKKVELEFDGKNEKDKYGRLLAYIHVNGTTLEEELVKKGLARVAFTFPDAKMLPELKKLEAEAMKKKIGIYQHEGYVTRTGYNVAAWQ